MNLEFNFNNVKVNELQPQMQPHANAAADSSEPKFAFWNLVARRWCFLSRETAFSEPLMCLNNGFGIRFSLIGLITINLANEPSDDAAREGDERCEKRARTERTKTNV